MIWRFTLGAGLLFLAAVPLPAAAGYDYKFDSREVTIGQFESEISSKLVRGVENTLYGWTEMFRIPAEWSGRIDRGTFQAVTLGIPYGMFRFVGRTIIGVYEITTCYAPQGPIMAPIQGDVV